MCLAVPARVIAVIDDQRCRVDLGGIRQEIATSLIEDVTVGEYLIVHVGFALGRIDAGEAERTLRLLADLAPPDAKAPA